MKRQIAGLSHASRSNDEPPDGEYLVRIVRSHYHWNKSKPYYIVHFEVLEPAAGAHKTFNARIYSSVKALWKLNWFLRDFNYDPDLLGRDELDEHALRGLTGVVQVAHKTFDGHTILSLEAFAPAERWSEMFGTMPKDEEAA